MRASPRPNSSMPWPLNPSTGRASSPQTLYKPKFTTEPRGAGSKTCLPCGDISLNKLTKPAPQARNYWGPWLQQTPMALPV
jgi:hypothetical protein